jgi:hypothetical protein
MNEEDIKIDDPTTRSYFVSRRFPVASQSKEAVFVNKCSITNTRFRPLGLSMGIATGATSGRGMWQISFRQSDTEALTVAALDAK